MPWFASKTTRANLLFLSPKLLLFSLESQPRKMAKPRWDSALKYLIVLLHLHLGSVFSAPPADPFGQQQLDRVAELPGQSFNLSFAHFSGYVPVNEDSGRALFYWFVEAAEDPHSKPIVLWLNGGPPFNL